MFTYYRVDFKLITPMLGTATETSIYHTHVIEKAKKEIAKANKLGSKISKPLDKYKGSDITEDKHVKELQGVTRSFCQLMGKPLDVPNNIEDLLTLNVKLDEEFKEQLKKQEQVKATAFLRSAEGKPLISTHMILGNFKENMKITVNGGDKSMLPSKVSVGETFALDVKAVEPFMIPSNDILRCDYGTEPPIAGKGRNVVDQKNRVLLERPLKADVMGKSVTAIAMSEQLPEGTTFGTILRIRNGGKITEATLIYLLNCGRSNGLGSWRGSGNMGAYKYKLEKLANFVEEADADGFI